MPRILLVEDEESVRLAIRDRLVAEGYVVDPAADGQCALQKAGSTHFDAVVLDVMLPGISGFDVCRDLRARGNTVPILMLTARGQLIDKVVGLKLGADDYLTKPFEMLELQARLEALLRRDKRVLEQPEVCRFGDVEVDFPRAEVRRAGIPVDVSSKELELLQFLFEHRGLVLSRNRLLDEVWGYNAMPATRTVDVHVSCLRQKLEADPAHPRYIITVHRRGYKFVG